MPPDNRRIVRLSHKIGLVPGMLQFSVSVVLNANASTPSSTPAVVPAGLTDAGSGHANAIHSYPKGTAVFADLRDGAHRLVKRRRRHGLG
jgi:hypothetical protein